MQRWQARADSPSWSPALGSSAARARTCSIEQLARRKTRIDASGASQLTRPRASYTLRDDLARITLRRTRQRLRRRTRHFHVQVDAI